MSYRAFKRLLGETSLERKCRFLLGGAVLVLVGMSFWLFAWLTEQLALDQLTNTGRLLVDPTLAKLHLADKEGEKSLEEYLKLWESHWPNDVSSYHYYLLKANARQNKPTADEAKLIQKFQEDPD